MVKFCFVLAAFCIFQFASCRIVREAPAAPPTFTELAKQAQDALDVLHTQFLNTVGVKNDGELVTLVQNEGKSYADKLQDLVKKLGEETKVQAGKADEVFSGISTQLQSTIQDLKSQNPELVANTEKFQASFQENLKKVLQNTDEFGAKLKEDGQEITGNVQEVLKQIYDSTVQAAKKVSADVEAAIKDNKSS